MRLFLSMIAAASLGVLIVLVSWDFELRTIYKLAVYSAIIGLLVCPLWYWYLLRAVSPQALFRTGHFLLCGLLILLANLLVVPFYISAGRTIATVALVTISAMGTTAGVYPFLFSRGFHWNLRTILVLLILGGAVGTGIVLFNSFSVRMYGDDFCYSLRPGRLGYFGAVMHFYTHWSGRFFSNFLVMAFAGWRWTTLVQILAILGASYFAMHKILRRSVVIASIVSLAAAVWIPFSVFSIIPDFYKSLYWIVSSVVVLPVMALIPLYIVVAFTALDANTNGGYLGGVLASCLLSFMIATTHEAAVLGWLTVQTMAFGWNAIFFKNNRRVRFLLGAGMAATTLGLAVIMLSPGTVLRGEVQGYNRVTTIFGVGSNTVRYFLQFLQSIPLFGWLTLMSVVCFGWLVDTTVMRNFKAAISTLAITMVIAATCFIPGVFAMSDMIPLRTQLIPCAYLVYGMFMTGMFLPRPSDKRFLVSLCTILLIFVPIVAAQNIRRVVPTIIPMQQFARDWDARDRAAREGQVDVSMISIPWEAWEQEFGCVQNYYQSFNADHEK